ncbi:MAG TPA: DUF2846 domain-containing protein [Caulobacteraceae bacterium]|jgi:hypothetical protein
MKTILAAVAAAALLGSVCQAQPSGDTSNAAAPSPKPKGALEVPPPPEGKGEIVFYRKSAFTGMAVWFNVRENGAALGKLSNGTYFVAVADPGEHTYSAATENKDTLHLQIDPGETYYVEGRLSVGIMMGEANLAPTDEAAFAKAGHMKLVKSPAAPAAP